MLMCWLYCQQNIEQHGELCFDHLPSLNQPTVKYRFQYTPKPKKTRQLRHFYSVIEKMEQLVKIKFIKKIPTLLACSSSSLLLQSDDQFSISKDSKFSSKCADCESVSQLIVRFVLIKDILGTLSCFSHDVVCRNSLKLQFQSFTNLTANKGAFNLYLNAN